MKKLVIVGTSNPNVYRLIENINKKNKNSIEVKCYVDNDNKKCGKMFMNKIVLDSKTFLETYKNDECFLFNSIASSMKERKKLTEFYLDKGFDFQSLIHPDLDLNYVTVGKGVFLQENSLVQANSKISDYVIISSNSCIAHDSSVGKFTFIGGAVYVCGRVEIGENCFIGVGAKILPDLTIGNNSIIGAGSIVTKNVEENSRVMGIPAKVY